MMRRTIGLVITAVLAAFIVGACGDDTDDGSGAAGPSTTAAEQATTTVPGNEASEAEAEPASLDATRDALGLDTLALDPVDVDGSHPTLSWQAIDGAATYWLSVHDAHGYPYWAWTGSATSVRLGGGDRAETNQTAALHDTMTWSVLALDADGNPVALSEEAPLEP